MTILLSSLSRTIIPLIISFFIIGSAYSNNIQINYTHGFISYKELNKSYLQAKENKDTLSMTKRLISLSSIDRDRGDYDLAFNKLWDAQLIAEKKQHLKLSVLVNRHLGILYDIYEKDSLALDHFKKAVNFSKKITGSKITGSKIWAQHQLRSNYYCISNFWRDRKDYTLAMQYLDSCSNFYEKNSERPYFWTDRGYCYLKLGNITEAKKYLYKAKAVLKKKQLAYMVPNLSFLGDLKNEQLRYDSALIYYNQSLQLLEKYKIHTKYKPELLEKISDIYIRKGNLLEAVNHLKASKQSYERLFSTSSKLNKHLFEIKNKYKEQLAKHEKTIGSQDIVIKEQNNLVFRLAIVLGTIIVLTIGIYLFISQRNKIKKLSFVQQLTKVKNAEILEMKSKELTSSSLIMIELEDSIHILLEEIKKLNSSKYQLLKKKYAKKQNNSWDEFNKRFIEVNNQFHTDLCTKHPELSPSELKHCALIRLKLDNHEISKLLNLSQQSLHTSRYRIRKKMGIESSASLTSYIGSI